MPNFTDLPYEIRLVILKGLIKGVRDSNSTPVDRLSIFAVVCKEWQNVFERETFRQLILSPSRLQDLYQKIKHRKAFVKHIWYPVELQRYSCGACTTRELPGRILAVSIYLSTYHFTGFANRYSRITKQPPRKSTSSLRCCRTGMRLKPTLETGLH